MYLFGNDKKNGKKKKKTAKGNVLYWIILKTKKKAFCL